MKVSISGHHASMVFFGPGRLGRRCPAGVLVDPASGRLGVGQGRAGQNQAQLLLDAPGGADLLGRVVGGEDFGESRARWHQW